MQLEGEMLPIRRNFSGFRFLKWRILGGKQRPGPYYFAVLEWRAPKETGGAPIQEYRVQQRIADRNQSAWELKYKGPAESTTIENLPPGSRIEFRVQEKSYIVLYHFWIFSN